MERCGEMEALVVNDNSPRCLLLMVEKYDTVVGRFHG